MASKSLLNVAETGVSLVLVVLTFLLLTWMSFLKSDVNFIAAQKAQWPVTKSLGETESPYGGH